jgi:NAD+ kinase
VSDRRNVYFFYKKEDDLIEKINSLIEFAKENEFNVVEDPTQANVIVSIGGDGHFYKLYKKQNSVRTVYMLALELMTH